MVNEKDLADALNKGVIAAAGLDVLSSEPPQYTNPLLTAKNCFITPHIAWATKEARVRLMQIAVGNLKGFIKGAIVNNVAEMRRMEEDKNTLGLHPEVREEDRVAKAVALFREGYNCSQSVVTAFADLYGFTREQALHMSASFGGGIGRMRETCGAACGMFLLAGLEKCAVEGKDRESKAANYALVQELAEEFKKRNGALRCADLLGLSRKEPVVSTPEARTEQYYAKRPCARMVEEAARIWSEHLEKQKK